MSPYDVLGVSPSATDEEIARAYKRLARRYHPDLNPNDSAAAEKMGRINRAYDDVKAMRQRGAQTGPQSGPGPGYGGNPFDPFFTGQTYYTYTYTRRPRRSPIGLLAAVLVMYFLLRLLIGLLFGGYGAYRYVGPYSYYGTAPGYGYYTYYSGVPAGD